MKYTVIGPLEHFREVRLVAAAKALSSRAPHHQKWEDLSEVAQQEYIKDAAAAIDAYRGYTDATTH